MFSRTINTEKFTQLSKKPKFQKAEFKVRTICRRRFHWIPMLFEGEDFKEVIFVQEELN